MTYSIDKVISLVMDKLENWIDLSIKMLPNLVLAFVFLFVFYLLGKFARRVSNRVLAKFSKNIAVNEIITQVVFLAFLTVGIFVSLGILELEKTVTSLLAGAGILGLALGFAFQDIASNFMSGLLIAFRKPYRTGDVVKIQGYLGKVEKISLRTTSIISFQGQEIIVPNKSMFTETLINYNTTGKRRVEVEIGVSYGDGIEKCFLPKDENEHYSTKNIRNII